MEESEKTIELILTSTAGVILMKIIRYANEQCFIAPYLVLTPSSPSLTSSILLSFFNIKGTGTKPHYLFYYSMK